MDADRCTPNPKATARAYVSGVLTPAEAAEFEDHFLGCLRCSEPLQFTKHFAIAVQHSAERLRTDPSTRAIVDIWVLSAVSAA
jgi:hypothetical protein